MLRLKMKKRVMRLILFSVMITAMASCGVSDVSYSTEGQIHTEEQELTEVQIPAEMQESQEAQNSLEVEESLEAQNQPEIEYIRITPQEAQEMMLTEDVIILDVRTQEEFDEGHIPGAVLLPSSEVRENATRVAPDLNRILLVYCRAGSRSETSARILIDMGYTRVYDFGGINNWHGEIVK